MSDDAGGLVGELVVLVADKDMEQAVLGLLARHESLGIRALRSFKVFTHPERDGGCRAVGHEVLRTQARQFDFALMMFDREGSGRDDLDRIVIESEAERLLAANGWKDRSAVVVLDPELEIWVWSDSPQVLEAIGWRGTAAELRAWLEKRDFGFDGDKPVRPKEALRSVLRATRKQPSSALFRSLSERVGLARCSDASFAKFQSCLSSWFAV